MRLDELDNFDLRDLESTIGQLLIDEPDMKLSELQNHIIDILRARGKIH